MHWDNYGHDDRYTDLKVFPICSCGQVIKQLSFSNSYAHGFYMVAGGFAPAYCPGCGKEIRSLQYINLEERFKETGRFEFDYEDF